MRYRLTQPMITYENPLDRTGTTKTVSEFLPRCSGGVIAWWSVSEHQTTLGTDIWDVTNDRIGREQAGRVGWYGQVVSRGEKWQVYYYLTIVNEVIIWDVDIDIFQFQN